MSVDPKEVETVILALSKGVAIAFPVAAPEMALLGALLAGLDAAGVIPQQTTAVNIEQVRAQMAGVAAAASSAVTEVQAAKKAPAPVLAQTAKPAEVAPAARAWGNGSKE